jgi:hypothetical protein
LDGTANIDPMDEKAEKAKNSGKIKGRDEHDKE